MTINDVPICQWVNSKLPLNPLKGTWIPVNNDLTANHTHFQISTFSNFLINFSLADFRRVFANFRRIKSYIPGFDQRFVGSSAHSQSQEPRTKSQNNTKYQVLSTKYTSSPNSEPRTKNQESGQSDTSSSPHRLITSLLHHTIGTSAHRHIVLLAILLLTPTLNAQLLTPLSNEMNRRVEYEMIQNGTPFFTVMKPYVELEDSTQYSVLSTKTSSSPHHLITSSPYSTDTSLLSTPYSVLRTEKWFHRKLFNESLIEVDSGIFYLYADPVFEFGLGRETSGRNTYINSRGLRAGGRLGKYVAFGTEFYENQGVFNSVVSEQIRKKMIAPGEGLARKYDSTGYDFAHSTGYISVILLKKLNIQFAHSRKFIGDGYRSLLLSDASYPYPNLNFTWRSEFFMYSWSTLLLQDREVDGFKKGPFRRKSATIHTVAFNIKNKAQIALVRMQLYNNPDSFSNYKVTFSQLNPILIPENNSNAHSVWGLNLKVTPLPQLVIYNQWAVDNLFGKLSKHTAMQMGSKYYGTFGNHTVYLQAEYNRVPAKMYTSDNKIFNWVHFREPLAHPYGHNFQEMVIKGIWGYNHWQLSCQAVLAKQLETLPANFPIYKYTVPYYANGEKLNWYNAELAYFFNRKTLMNLALGYNYRVKTSATNTLKMHYVYFTFSTRLFNKYYDF